MLRSWILLLLCVWGINVQAMPRDEIAKVITDQEAAWNRGDLDTYMLGYWHNENMRFVSNKGFRYGWESTLKAYKKHYPNAAALGELTFTIKDIKILSNEAAIVVGQWELVRIRDNPKGAFTLLMEKIDGSWLITHDHTSE